MSRGHIITAHVISAGTPLHAHYLLGEHFKDAGHEQDNLAYRLDRDLPHYALLSAPEATTQEHIAAALAGVKHRVMAPSHEYGDVLLVQVNREDFLAAYRNSLSAQLHVLTAREILAGAGVFWDGNPNTVPQQVAKDAELDVNTLVRDARIAADGPVGEGLEPMFWVEDAGALCFGSGLLQIMGDALNGAGDAVDVYIGVHAPFGNQYLC